MNKLHPHIQLAGTATVGPKGQVVIPADVREKMNIAPGDKLLALYIEHKHAISFIPQSRAQKLIDAMGAQLSEFQNLVEESDKQ
jgi:AbrB family looped-hinge helix DNA binding protein